MKFLNNFYAVAWLVLAIFSQIYREIQKQKDTAESLKKFAVWSGKDKACQGAERLPLTKEISVDKREPCDNWQDNRTKALRASQKSLRLSLPHRLEAWKGRIISWITGVSSGFTAQLSALSFGLTLSQLLLSTCLFLHLWNRYAYSIPVLSSYHGSVLYNVCLEAHSSEQFASVSGGTLYLNVWVIME